MRRHADLVTLCPRLSSSESSQKIGLAFVLGLHALR